MADEIRKFHVVGNLGGKDGYTPVKGVDYFTSEDMKNLGSYPEPVENAQVIVGNGEQKVVYDEKIADHPFDLVGTAFTGDHSRAPKEYTTFTQLKTTWNKYNFIGVRMSPYKEVRFAIRSDSYYGVMKDNTVYNETTNKGEWLEIKLCSTGILSVYPIWELYYGEELVDDLVMLPNDTLADLNFRFGDGTYVVSELIGTMYNGITETEHSNALVSYEDGRLAIGADPIDLMDVVPLGYLMNMLSSGISAKNQINLVYMRPGEQQVISLNDDFGIFLAFGLNLTMSYTNNEGSKNLNSTMHFFIKAKTADETHYLCNLWIKKGTLGVETPSGGGGVPSTDIIIKNNDTEALGWFFRVPMTPA